MRRPLLLLPTLLLGLCLLSPTARSEDAAKSKLLFEQTDSSPIVNLALVLKTGGAQDPEGLEGLTNFVGEMLLRGTRSKSKSDFERQLDELGGEIAVEVRAEALIIRCSVLNRKIEPFLALLKEAITEQSFSQKEIEKLRNELLSGLNDIKSRDGRLAQEVLPDFLFPDHPYGNFLMGTTKSLRAIKQKNIREHYQRMFSKNALTLVGSGPIAPTRMTSWLEELNERLTVSKTQFAKLPPVPIGAERRVILIDKPERTQTQVLIAQRGTLIHGEAFFPLYIGNFAFGGGSFSSRLMQEVRVKRGWSYGAGSSFRYGTRERSWTLSFMPKNQDTLPALKQVLHMLDELKADGVTEAEFTQAQSALANGAAFTSNTPEKRIENRVLEVTLDLPLGYMDTWKRGILETKRKAVNRELEKFISPQSYTILVLATKTPELLQGLEESTGVKQDQIKIVPYNAAL
jgi:zinc protease